MRTKTLLLTAAITVAGFTFSSLAQVYSANVVGYVNVVCKGNGAFTLVCNPLDDGTNTLDSVLAGMPNKTGAQLWGGTSFNSPLPVKAAGSFAPNNSSVPVGTGFFVKTPVGSADITNTFVGTVVPGPAGTNTVALTGLFQLVGSTFPVGGTLNDVGTGTLNLNATIPNKSQVQTWDNSGSGVFTSPIAGKVGGVFNPNYTLSVGQGFFVKAFTPTNWVQVSP